jgi:hypothetical protein
MSRSPHCLDNRITDFGEVVNLTRRPHSAPSPSPKEDSWYSFQRYSTLYTNKYYDRHDYKFGVFDGFAHFKPSRIWKMFFRMASVYAMLLRMGALMCARLGLRTFEGFHLYSTFFHISYLVNMKITSKKIWALQMFTHKNKMTIFLANNSNSIIYGDHLWGKTLLTYSVSLVRKRTIPA